MNKRRSKKPSERCNSRRAGIGTPSKCSDKNQNRHSSLGVNAAVHVTDALLHPLSGRMVASQRAIARSYGVADSTVGRLVALGYIRRHGSLLDLADAISALGNRPSPGRPPHVNLEHQERSQSL